MFGLNPYLIGGVAAVIVALGSFGGCQYVRAEAAVAKAQKETAKREGAEAARDKAIEANTSQQVTIEAQSAALDKWAKIGTSPDQVAALVQDLKRFSDQLAARAAANDKLKENDLAKPDCAALLAVSVQRACPGIAAGLRNYAGGHQNNPGRDPGAGAAPAPGKPDGRLSTAVSVPSR